MPGILKAHVSTYGGEKPNGLNTVQHWQLHVDGKFIADTSAKTQAELFQRIADALNQR